MFLFDSKKIAKVIFKELLNSDQNNFDKKINNFLFFIKKNKLEKNIKQIIKYIEIELEKNKKDNSIILESNIRLREGDIDNIFNKLNLDKKSNLLFIENKKMLGGFVIKTKDKIYNGSLLNNLNRLKDSIKS